MADFDAGSIAVAFRTNVNSLGRGVRALKGFLATAGAAVNRFAGRVKVMGLAITRTFTGMFRIISRFRLLLGLSFIAAGAAAAKFTVDFDSSMSKIVGLVGVARDQVDLWKEDLISLGPEVGKGPAELARALFFVTSAGIRGSEAIDTLTASAQAASAGLGETETVADALTSALNAYRETNLTAADAAGILVATVREGKAEAESLAPALGRILPIASKLGVGFDQVGAAMAAMTRLGLGADESATSLRATLLGILKPGKDAQKALKEFGLSAEGLRKQVREKGLLSVLQTLKETFGDNEVAMTRVFPNVRALTGVLALVGQNADKAKEIFQALAKAGVGDLDKAFKEAETTFRVRFGKAFARIQGSLIRLGKVVLPFVIPIVEKFSRGFDFLAQRATFAMGVVTGVFNELKKQLGEGGFGSLLEKLASATLDLIVSMAASIRDFVAAEGPEIVKAAFVAIALFVGPATIKVMGIVVAHIKGGLTRVINFLAFSFFELPKALLNNFIQHLQALTASTIADIIRTLVTAFEGTAIGQTLFSAEDFDSVREMATLIQLSGAEARKNAQSVQEVVTETLLKAKNASKAIAATVETDVAAIVQEIELLKVDLRESGVSKAASEEIIRIVRSGFKMSTDAFGEALKGVAGTFELNMDDIIAKAQAASLKIANLGGTPTGDIDAPGDAGGDAVNKFKDVKSEIDDIVDKNVKEKTLMTGDLLGDAIGSAVIGGISQGEEGMTIVADFGRALFEDVAGDLISNAKDAMNTAITEVGGKAAPLISSLANIALAAVGLILSSLDKAKSKTTSTFSDLEEQISNSQLVRGVVAGPTSVAISKVGDNLRRAMVGVEQRLDFGNSVLMEIRDGVGGAGGGPVAQSSGNVQTP